MTKSIRWRVIVLQVVMVLVLGFAAGGALYASNFITYPDSQSVGSPADLLPANGRSRGCQQISPPMPASRSSMVTRRMPTPRISSGCT